MVLFRIQERRDGDSRGLVMVMDTVLRACLLLLAALQCALLAVRQSADSARAARRAEAPGAEGAIVALLARFAQAAQRRRWCDRGRRGRMGCRLLMGWRHLMGYSIKLQYALFLVSSSIHPSI